jgi:hypothetical protein
MLLYFFFGRTQLVAQLLCIQPRQMGMVLCMGTNLHFSLDTFLHIRPSHKLTISYTGYFLPSTPSTHTTGDKKNGGSELIFSKNRHNDPMEILKPVIKSQGNEPMRTLGILLPRPQILNQRHASPICPFESGHLPPKGLRVHRNNGSTRIHRMIRQNGPASHSGQFSGFSQSPENSTP